MKEIIRLLRKDSFVFYPFVVSKAIVVIESILIAFVLKYLPGMVPLFYSLPRASERLAHKNMLFLLPISCLVILFVNLIIIVFVIRHDSVIARIVSLSGLLFSLLSLYTLVRIILLIL